MAHEAWSPSSPLEAQIAMSQEVLDGLVSARMLKPKLLARPPFTYLHDLVMELLYNTGFAPGLYSLDEQDPAYYQQGEKEAKVSFLFKLMSVVSLVLQAPCPADPFKVVSGLEPENTNIFLQMLGKACMLTDGADVVQAVLALEQTSEEEAVQQLPEDMRLPSFKPSHTQQPRPQLHPLAHSVPAPSSTELTDQAGPGPGSGASVDAATDGSGGSPRGSPGTIGKLIARARDSPLLRAVFRKGQAAGASPTTPGTPLSPRSGAADSEGGLGTPHSYHSCPSPQAAPPAPSAPSPKQQQQQQAPRASPPVAPRASPAAPRSSPGVSRASPAPPRQSPSAPRASSNAPRQSPVAPRATARSSSPQPQQRQHQAGVGKAQLGAKQQASAQRKTLPKALPRGATPKDQQRQQPQKPRPGQAQAQSQALCHVKGAVPGELSDTELGPEANAGCMPGLQLSEQMRRISQSTSAGLAAFRRNNTAVHPSKEP